ncbi:putative RNA methyltransferase [Aquipuribacter sp. SD81]|uniref:putative RNA methyltransferase n=1 Tax=Aquipuribacter sp. SD81 TaxID=3127703 RepID=UPI0030191824
MAPALACPVCGASLALVEGTPRALRCADGHSFDVARQGHVVLLSGGTRLRADTTDMVAARARVLGSGAYDPVTATVRDALVAAAPPAGLLLDLGAGTGHHTAAVLDALPGRDGVALELSVPALRRAARAHTRLAAVGADLTRPLPLRGGVAGAVLALFAPLPTVEELARVCAPGAVVVVVTPEPGHLATLRTRLDLLDVPAGKPDRLADRLGTGFGPVACVGVEARVRWTAEQAGDVVAMGPNAWHPSAARTASLAAMAEHAETTEDTVAVTVSSFVRR